MKTTSTTKNTKTNLGLTLAPAGTYPVVYAEDLWQVGIENSKLAKLFGATGAYSQEEINEKLMDVAAAAGMPVVVAPTTASITSPAEDTLYLIYSTDTNVILDKYTYTTTGGFTKVGSVSVDDTKFTKKSGTYTGDKVIVSVGTDSVGESAVTKDNLVNLVNKEFLGAATAGLPDAPAEGTLADMLSKFRANDNKIGSGSEVGMATDTTLGTVRVGFTESNSGSDTTRNYAVKLNSEGDAYVNVPWAASASGLTDQQKEQLAAFKDDLSCATELALTAPISSRFSSAQINAFVCPLIIPTDNIFGISTSTAVRTICLVTKTSVVTGSQAFAVYFEVGTYKFTAAYNGSSFTLYHENYVLGEASSETTFAI